MNFLYLFHIHRFYDHFSDEKRLWVETVRSCPPCYPGLAAMALPESDEAVFSSVPADWERVMERALRIKLVMFQALLANDGASQTLLILPSWGSGLSLGEDWVRASRFNASALLNSGWSDLGEWIALCWENLWQLPLWIYLLLILILSVISIVFSFLYEPSVGQKHLQTHFSFIWFCSVSNFKNCFWSCWLALFLKKKSLSFALD